ncbi:hypothetical protein QUA56_28815 [Microcoleus sp. N3A4]|uniref:hypothetical protein n=1 Tax=Microcoleus sp. N3A4 TaxID=3055379 RepID=UPI002FD54BD9
MYKTFLVSLDSLCLSARSPDCLLDRLIVGSSAHLSAQSTDCRYDLINDVAIDRPHSFKIQGAGSRSIVSPTNHFYKPAPTQQITPNNIPATGLNSMNY